MTNSEKSDQSPRTDRLRSVAAVVGVLLIGPALLGFVISHFIAGELPGRDPVTAAENPILFYLIISALGYGAFKMMQLSLLFVVGHFRGKPKALKTLSEIAKGKTGRPGRRTAQRFAIAH